MTADTASYLQIYLAPLNAIFARTDVTDIYINRPGEVWVEALGGTTERHDMPELTEGGLWRLARQVANLTHQGISREHPLLSARLPDGARIQIVAPPATRGPMAIAIRKYVTADLTLDDYSNAGAFTDTRAGNDATAANDRLHELYQKNDWPAFLKAAAQTRKTILISGGTSSGKTTFLNALMKEIPQKERLILIEDTPELLLRHDNAIGLVAARGHLGEAEVTMDDLMTASLRLRPDRIILGELRGAEAFTFLRAINSGHPGSMTTIHADSCERALEQLTLLLLQTGTSLRRQDALDHAARQIDIVVQLKKDAGRRAIAEVRWQELGQN